MHSIFESKPCLPDWLKDKLNQVAPILLGKQASYPIEFWHGTVGLPNNGCLLEDVPTSIVSSSEISDLFNYPNYDSFKKLSIYHLKNDTQAKKFIEWHNKVYCCQPYNGELCQCFVRAYLAHFGGRINVNWARTAYEYYKRLREKSVKRDPHLIQIPIPALDKQLLALKNLFIEITLNPISFTQPNSFCCNDLDQSSNKKLTNSICSEFVENKPNETVIQSIDNSNSSLSNSKILQEIKNTVLQKSFSTNFNQILKPQVDNVLETEFSKKSNDFFNDIHKDLCLVENKKAMISQEIHGCGRSSSNKSEYLDIQSPPRVGDRIENTSLFTLGFLKASEDSLYNAFGKCKDCDSVQEIQSVVNELLEISTSSGSEEVSARGISIENDIFSPRACIEKQCTIANYNVMNQVTSSTQVSEVEFHSTTHCINVGPDITGEKTSTILQSFQNDKDKNLLCIPKFIEHEQEQNTKLESLVPLVNNKNNSFMNKNSNLKESNNSLNVSPPLNKENLIKPRQRIGISILIQKFGKHNNQPPIKNSNEHQVRHNDMQEEIAYNSSMIVEPSDIQKPFNSFRSYDLESSATTISPPYERAPLSIDAQEDYDNSIEENNNANGSHNVKISNAINEGLKDKVMPITCSNTMCSSCNCNSIDLIDFNHTFLHNDGSSKDNTKFMLEWSKEPCLSHETKMSSIKENIKEKKEKFTSKISNILYECFDSTNYAKTSHLNSKIDFSLQSFNSNNKNKIGTNYDSNVDITASINIPKLETNEELSKIYYNSQDKTTNKSLLLKLPPLHLEKVVCQNNKSFANIEEIHALDVMKDQLDSSRIEISARTCSTCSTQQSNLYFPYCVELSNSHSTTSFASEQITSRIQKQHFCATLVHHIETCDMNMESNIYKSSIIPNLNDETKISTMINTKVVENLDIQLKPQVCHVCNDDSINCNDIKDIFKDSYNSLQVFKDCNRGIKQCGSRLCIRPLDEVDMMYSIKSSVPSMKCVQAESILEKKKGALATEKATVEGLIQKGDSQYALNQQLTSIFKSKLEAYNKLRAKVQNLTYKISEDEDNHSQLSLYREEKQDKEDMIEFLQKEIAELHKLHRDVQAQLDMGNCMLVESLMALDNLTLDVEKAQKEVEQIIKEESFNQRSISIAEGKSNLMYEVNMVDTLCTKEPFEISKAMKTMIQIQQNRFKNRIDERSFNKNDTNYDSTIEEILKQEFHKKDEICMDSKMSMKTDDTIMPTMATLSHSSNLKSETKSAKMATLLVKDCMKRKQNIDVSPHSCGDDNILQWLNTNVKNKSSIKSRGFKDEIHEDCDDVSTVNCFHQKLDDVESMTTNSVIDEHLNYHAPIEKTSNSSSDSSSITSYSGHYYDILQCKQRLKHEKCDIHGIDLKMVCAYPIKNLSRVQNKIKKDIIHRYGACDIHNKEKALKFKKLAITKAKPPFQQSARIGKIMSKEEQVFESYKALGFARKAHNHLNEFDADLSNSNRQRNIPIKTRGMKVKNQELHKMIDDIMLLNHESVSIKNSKETK